MSLSERWRQRLIERAASAAADSRATILAMSIARKAKYPCCQCGIDHPLMFTFRGRDRAWHRTPEAQMSPAMRRTRDMALVLADEGL